LLSPANLGGERSKIVFNPKATFPLAQQLRSPEGAPLGEVFSFVSGLYFRGKMTYAQAFGSAPEGLAGALVISAGEGLRFLHEPVTLERLSAWAGVAIDEKNPRFTEPLLAHARALYQALGSDTRFVLLGSVASDKYVRPLAGVFGDALLFPPVFVGRGDMSRGSLLLRAARARQELEYAPIAGAERHGPRPTPLRARPSPSTENGAVAGAATQGCAQPAATVAAELVIFVGLPGSGKTTFFRERFAASHAHISKDNLKRSARREHRQSELLQHALVTGKSVVVDNTNVGLEERAQLIATARRHGVRVIGYYFDCALRDCLTRNRARAGAARIPDVGIFTAAKRLVAPALSEGFDALYSVKAHPEAGFEVIPLAASTLLSAP
jgi:predicted kinase